MPHTEGRSPWGRIDVADDDHLVVAILADPDLPPFLITISVYDLFFLTLGTGVTFSCCCMLRNVSLLQGERNP